MQEENKTSEVYDNNDQRDAQKQLEEEEEIQKKKLNEMKKEEYHWYKIKMIGAAILVPIVYLIFFLLMKYAWTVNVVRSHASPIS